MYQLSEEEYQRWFKDKNINPKTNRQIKWGSRTFKKIQSAFENHDLSKTIKPCELCFNDVDPLTFEQFSDKQKKYELIMIGDASPSGKFHCYETKSFLNYASTMLKKDGFVKNPLNPSYYLTAADFDQIEKKGKFINPRVKLPKTQSELIILNSGSFFHVLLKCKKMVYDCGFFPSFVQIDEEKNSLKMLYKIMWLWDNSKLLLSLHPFKCCLEEFCQPQTFWLKPDGSFNEPLFLSFMKKLNNL